MDIESIKKLIKEGDVPQARSQLKEVLSKTPEDTVAQMLYGTCCQLMGDSVTFNRIYWELAPEMELRVAHGERSERVSMWLKYVAMFAVVISLGCSAPSANEGVSSTAIGSPANEISAVTTENDSSLYESVLKMSPRDQLLYFLQRPEVSRELHKGKPRAAIIPMQGRDGIFEGRAYYLFLIQVDCSLKTGTDVIKALEDAGDEAFVLFSSRGEVRGLREGEMISSRRMLVIRREVLLIRHRVLRRLEAHGDVSDLILSSDGSDSHVLGISIIEPPEPPEPHSAYGGPLMMRRPGGGNDF